MNNNINLIAFGTFGNPNGFRQTFFSGNKDLERFVKTFDLNTNAIKLFPKSKLYSIRKEHVNGLNTIAYAVYSFAKEQNSDRSGTFIGSSILFTDKIAEENITISCLTEFQENLVNKYVQNDVIAVNHSDKFSLNKPKNFEKTEFHLKDFEDLDFLQSTNKYLVVFCETTSNKLQHLFKQAIDLLNNYDTIYFTSDKEVAMFVKQKGIFKLIQDVGDKTEFEQEIQNLKEERKRKIESSICDFEKEKLKLQDDRNKVIEEYKKIIEKNEKVHLENEQKIKDEKNVLHKIDEVYSDFSELIDNLINQIKSGKKLNNIKHLYYENKQILIGGINQLKKPQLIHNILDPNITTSLRVENQYINQNELYNEGKRYGEGKEKYKIDIFKVVSFVLFLLWILTLSYFFFFNEKKEGLNLDVKQTLKLEEKVSKQPLIDSTLEELNPTPNAELAVNDCLSVAKKLKYNIDVNYVVKTVFDRNPTDVKNSYLNQVEAYSKQLVILNKQCFEKKGNIFFFVKDTLRHIPSYKK